MRLSVKTIPSDAMYMLTRQIKTSAIIATFVALTGISILFVLLFFNDFLTQILLIALILLSWPAVIILNSYRKKRKVEKESAESENETSNQKLVSMRPIREYNNLKGGVIETVDFLQRNRPADAVNGSAEYDLPWYLMIGGEDSGKTSFLLSGGLSFNALDSQRQSDQNLLRATLDCDWKVTDNSVFIDTAGRYQEEKNEDDKDEWFGLLNVIRKYRKVRSFDGVVITANARTLLSMQSVVEINQKAQLLRSRLNDAMTLGGGRIPVYMVFTHMDTLPGFRDFFRTLDSAEMSQIWGATLPLIADGQAHTLFDAEYNLLVEAVMLRRFNELSKTILPGEQFSIFNFPLLFADARQKLGEFVNELFKPSPFSTLPLLRGFYFTSTALGSQNSETQRLSTKRTSSNLSLEDDYISDPSIDITEEIPLGGGEKTSNTADLEPITSEGVRITSKGFFIEDYLKKALNADKNIAAAMQVKSDRPSRVRKFGIVISISSIFCIGLLSLVTLSYFNNKVLLKKSGDAGTAVLRHYKSRNDSVTSSLTTIEASDLNNLHDTLRTLDEYDDSYWSSLLYGFGLYSGNEVRSRLREIYFDYVSQRLLNPALDSLAADLEQLTRDPSGNNQVSPDEDPEQIYYDKLKAYLMVERNERVDSVFLMTQLDKYWGGGASVDTKRHLSYYAELAAATDNSETFVPRPKAIVDCVNNARNKLGNFSAAKQIYNQIMRDIEKEGQPYFLRDAVQGQQGSQWFEDITSPSVPYRYTKQAYYKHIKGEGLGYFLGRLLSKKENDWVLNRSAEKERVELSNLELRYENDYVTAWKKFLENLRIKSFSRKVDAVDALDSFSQPNSPFAVIVSQVAQQNKLSEPPTGVGIIDTIKYFLSSKAKRNTTVERAFIPLTSFKIETYSSKLRELRDMLNRVRGDEWGPAGTLRDDRNYIALRNSIRDLLTPLKTNPGSEAIATLLQRPVDGVDRELGRADKSRIEAEWTALSDTALRLESFYPFARGAQIQTIPDELAAYLNRVQQFYNDRLKNTFDNTPGQLRPLSDDYGYSEEFINYLGKIFKLRDALMPTGGGQLKFAYSITLIPPPAQTAEAIIDGTRVAADGAQQTATLTWPAPNQSNTGIKISLGALRSNQLALVRSFDGTWGIFKMASERITGNAQYQFNFNGVRLILQPPGVNDPFAVNYEQLRAPKRIFK